MDHEKENGQHRNDHPCRKSSRSFDQQQNSENDLHHSAAVVCEFLVRQPRGHHRQIKRRIDEMIDSTTDVQRNHRVQ